MIGKFLLWTVLVSLTTAGPLQAQQPPAFPQPQPIKRTLLQKFDVPGTPYETIIGVAEIAPNASIGRHTHPGTEAGYVLEGEAVLLVDGEPPRPLKAGDSYSIPSGVVHDVRAGAKGAKGIATYVIEKGRPLTSPAN